MSAANGDDIEVSLLRVEGKLKKTHKPLEQWYICVFGSGQSAIRVILSEEGLKKKWGDDFSNDPEILERLDATLVRQVVDGGSALRGKPAPADRSPASERSVASALDVGQAVARVENQGGHSSDRTGGEVATPSDLGVETLGKLESINDGLEFVRKRIDALSELKLDLPALKSGIHRVEGDVAKVLDALHQATHSPDHQDAAAAGVVLVPSNTEELSALSRDLEMTRSELADQRERQEQIAQAAESKAAKRANDLLSAVNGLVQQVASSQATVKKWVPDIGRRYSDGQSVLVRLNDSIEAILQSHEMSSELRRALEVASAAALKEARITRQGQNSYIDADSGEVI